MSRQKKHPMKLPMKTVLLPSTHEAYCCLCSEYIIDGYDRRHLWQTEDRKSRICTLVEQVLQVNIIKSVHTEFICRTCFTKVKNLNTKIRSTRDEIDLYVQQIGRHGAAMKCMKRDIRERITATEKAVSRHRHRETANNLVGRSFSENNFPSSLPEPPSGDGHQQSALMSASWMTCILPGTVLELGSSLPPQSISPSSSTPGDVRMTASSTRYNCVESTSRSTHNGDGSNNNDHKVCDTATGERNTPSCPSAGHHTYCQTRASHNDVRTSSDTHTEGVIEIAHLDTGLETERDHVFKAEQSDPQYPEDVGIKSGDKKKTEECGQQYVVPEVHDVVKCEDSISQYIDAQLSEDNQRNANCVKRAATRRKIPRRLWKCSSCRTVCLSRSALTIHDRIHTGVRPYTCDTCGRSFAQTSCLKTHMRTHTRERPFACGTCGKAYGTSSELKIHERTHRGERPYLCATCGKAFVSSSNLRQHETTHMLARPHACPTCDKAFVCYSQLTRHRKIHTGLRPHTCPTCGRSFVRGHHLARHVRSLHSSNE